MKFIYLMWRNLMKKKLRTFLTLASVFVAFLLYGTLLAFKTGFTGNLEITGIDRLVMMHKVSLVQPLPLAYQNRIMTDEDVEIVANANWFGGVYQDERNFFAQFAVSPREYLEIYPEILLPEEQKEAWLRNRIGAIVGRTTAEKYGFKVGDRIPIKGTIHRTPDNSPWEFVVEGIYDGAEGYDTTIMFFHYDYLTEVSKGYDGFVGLYYIKIKDAERAAEVATRIDKLFANSPAETKTSTEKAFAQSFANQAGNIQAIVVGVVTVVFFTLLLVAGNTMAQSVRERTGELGVLKTLGFNDVQVMGLVLGESFLITVLGGGGGLALIVWATRAFGDKVPFLPPLFISGSGVIFGILLIVAMGFLAGAVPAYQALRLNIVDALRRV